MVAWGRGAAAVENGRGLEAGGSGATLAVVRAGGRGGSRGSEGGGAVACSEQVTAADGGDAGVRQSLTLEKLASDRAT